MHYYYGDMMGWGWGAFGGVLMIVFWVLVILLIIWGVRTIARGGRMGRWHEHSRALDILNERYAKGEIMKEEYELKKKDIMNSA